MSSRVLDVESRIEKIVLRGAVLTREVAENVTSASISLATDKVSQLTVTLADPDLLIARSGFVTKDASVAYEDLRLVIATYAINGGPAGTGGITFEARTGVVAALKARQGDFMLHNLSRSDWVVAESKAAGGRAVVQPSASFAQLSRDHQPAGVLPQPDAVKPSSWTTFERYAKELGYWVFDVGDTIYFGAPSWFRANRIGPILTCGWLGVPDKYRTLSIPECRQSDDATNKVEVTVQLPYTRAVEARPGRLLRLLGMPTFTGTYIITNVDFSLAGAGLVTVKAITPHDPIPSLGNNPDATTPISEGATEIGGKGQYAELVNAAESEGFRGQGLITIVAIALAESGGQSEKSKQNSDGSYDYGAWQINDKAWTSSGFDPTRGLELQYSAHWAWIVSRKGTSFSDWYTFDGVPPHNAAYRLRGPKGLVSKNGGQSWMEVARDSIEYGGPSTTNGPTAQSSSKSAMDFVTAALAQKGDKYVLGVTASGDNPDAFDCSELVQWAAGRVGVVFQGGSHFMYEASQHISVADGIKIRGALLFAHFANPAPGTTGHVEISLGDGRTIAARSTNLGVDIFNAYNAGGDPRFDYAGLIIGMDYGNPELENVNLNQTGR